MARFVLTRLLWLAGTLWVVFTVSFFLMRAVPGGPFDENRDAPPEVRARLAARYHLDEPLLEQYLSSLSSYLRLDAGPSYRLPDYSVAQVIAEGLPRSLLLGGLALFFALVAGIVAGSVAAAFHGRSLDGAIMFLANLGIALPNFVIAGVLIILLCFVWGVLPPAGWGGIRQLVLPSFCLGAPFAAGFARLTRSGLLEELSQDYIRTATAKGLRRRRVVLRHALRLALLPVVSILGPVAAGILTGSLVIERIFAIPGIGSHFVQAALGRDYTLAMGVVLLYTAFVGAFNLLADLTYRALDPRVQLW